MNKLLFSFLWFVIALNGHAATVNETIQVGEIIEISPVRPGSLRAFANSYENSNPSVASVSMEQMSDYKETSGSYTYYWTRYKFVITGLKSGITTINLGYKENNTFTGYTTYIVNVVEVKSISIPSTLSFYLGESYTFSPIITDAEATTTLSWNSNNTSVATINTSGKITAVSVGTATITCTAQNGVSAQCVVTVNPRLVDGITLNETEAELVAGEKLQLTATIVPDNATDKGVTWSSSNSAVAVVNESGQVTAVGSGICNITATAKDGSGTASSCLVTVLGNVMFCEDFGAVPGAVITLPVQLTNDNAIQGFEFKLVLPDGLSVQTDGNGKLMATLTERASTQGLEGSNQGNGVYQFVFTSTTRLQGNNGAVVNVPLVVDNNMAIGQYNVVVKDVELVRYGTSSQIHHGDRSAALTVKPMTLGDVNGDGRVSVADAIAIINYVLGRTPVSFIAIAADVNGDNDISLADAVATVDIILAGGGANARAAKVLKIHDPQ